jgi:hypothetical protein
MSRATRIVDRDLNYCSRPIDEIAVCGPPVGTSHVGTPDKPPAVSIARRRTNRTSRAMLIFWVDPGLLPYSGHDRRRRLGSPRRVVL